MNVLKTTMLAAAALCAASLAGSASAMPLSGPASAAKALSGDLQTIRWVCGPYRCWWRPNYFYRPHYGFYGRPWWGGPRRHFAYRHGFYGGPWGRGWY